MCVLLTIAISGCSASQATLPRGAQGLAPQVIDVGFAGGETGAISVVALDGHGAGAPRKKSVSGSCPLNVTQGGRVAPNGICSPPCDISASSTKIAAGDVVSLSSIGCSNWSIKGRGTLTSLVGSDVTMLTTSASYGDVAVTLSGVGFLPVTCIIQVVLVPSAPFTLATHQEIPDDPDGPGHGPTPNFGVPQDQACPNGFELAFSNGSAGNPAGGAYCGVSVYQSELASLATINDVKFSTAHYWNRHLACYLHQTYTSSQWNQNVLGPDFQNRPQKPALGTSIEYTGAYNVTDGAGVSTQWAYRIYYLTYIPLGGVLTYNVYDVNTSFLVPRRVDCPKPYPNYP